MKLRPGFVYLENVSVVKDVALVYAIVSYVLQNARESVELSPELRLFSSNFEQVVLAPECFNRFNDGVVQACLLRAAYPSELDYSFSSEISADMAGILLKIIKSHGLERGEAAMEFALALAAGRLRLDKKNGLKLLDELREDTRSAPVLAGLLAIARRSYLPRSALPVTADAVA